MQARWNPWQELYDMQRETSDLMRRFFGGEAGSSRTGSAVNWAPRVDVLTRGGDIVVRAEIPGVDPDKDIDISFQRGLLTIRGERRSEGRSEQENYYRVESAYGSFQRTIPLPENINPEDVQASYDRGILEVVVPRGAELNSPRKIQVTSGGAPQELTTSGTKKQEQEPPEPHASGQPA
jgi:HSP20 family protein